MGMRTVVVINNDDLHEIRSDPAAFVDAICVAMHEPGWTRIGNKGWVDHYEHTSYPVTYRIDHLKPERVTGTQETPT